MDIRIIVVGIAIALVVGAGAGYTLSPNISSNQELGEYQKNIRTLENDKLELQTVLASTENENTELQKMLSNAKSLFESIETELTGIETGFGAPNYDSGWVPIDIGEKISLPHGLGTDENLFVYMIGRYYEGLTNQLYYGLCYWGQLVVGAGWTLDDTCVYVERGEADFDWDEVRVYIWRIPQGPTGGMDSSDDSALPDVKCIEIVLSGEETYNYTRIIDLSGYKDVAITWTNYINRGQLLFWWDIREPNGAYIHVGPVFGVDYQEGYNFKNDELGLWRWSVGSDSVKVGGKYFEISIPEHQTWRISDYEESDTVIIIIYATK